MERKLTRSDAVAFLQVVHEVRLVYQIDAQCKRLLWVGEKRTVKTLLRLFRWLGKERSAGLRFI
ncbi:MAG: hypothetical protein ACREVY_18445, partial [Gammaproteobacteria bacterium]